MRLPWRNLTGLAKSAAILASVLVISLALCGVNALAYGHSSGEFAYLLFATGVVELIGILVGALGVATVALIALAKWIHPRLFPNLK